MSRESFIACKSEIDAFSESVGEAPAQRSPEWYKLRQTTIGGSEIASLITSNHPYKGIESLIKEKVGITSFRGNIHTRWGTIFEHITKEYIEMALCMEEPITELGSIEGPILRQRYSPDGLGVVKLLKTNEGDDEKINGDNFKDEKINDEKINDDHYEYYKVLFEFKAPSRTIPDGKIPEHYVPQVLTGLTNIPIADFAIFVNNSYRKCGLLDLDFTAKYDVNFHDGDTKKKANIMTKTTQALACGVICFYQTYKQYYKVVHDLGYDEDVDEDVDEKELTLEDVLEMDDNVILNNYNSPYKESDAELLINNCFLFNYESEFIKGLDFGLEQGKNMERLFELHSLGLVSTYYMPLFTNSERLNELPFLTENHIKHPKYVQSDDIKRIVDLQFEEFSNMCEINEWISIGYLPFKLMLSDIIIKLPDEQWKEKIEPVVNQALTILDDILNAENKNDKYYEHFPVKSDANISINDIDDMQNMFKK